MKAKIISFLLIVMLLVLAVWLGGRRTNEQAPSANSEKAPGKRYDKNNDGNGFIRKVSYLEYTVHAKCRMQCRHITQEEVKDIMVHGAINYAKSDLNDRPCATYALEGYTQKDNQHVRIVFAQCSQKTKVVTCIDLENDFACDCK
jgi:hypothetical protein